MGAIVGMGARRRERKGRKAIASALISKRRSATRKTKRGEAKWRTSSKKTPPMSAHAIKECSKAGATVNRQFEWGARRIKGARHERKRERQPRVARATRAECARIAREVERTKAAPDHRLG
eukprot:1834321-Pleurochrysis_carterae.AAC.4